MEIRWKAPGCRAFHPAYPNPRQGRQLSRPSGGRVCLQGTRYPDGLLGGKGRGQFGDWVEYRFGIPYKLATLFSWLGSKIEKLPGILAAMDSGELT